MGVQRHNGVSLTMAAAVLMYDLLLCGSAACVRWLCPASVMCDANACAPRGRQSMLAGCMRLRRRVHDVCVQRAGLGVRTYLMVCSPLH